MALERIKTTIQNERAKPAMPTGGIHATPGRALAPAAVGHPTQHTMVIHPGQPEGVALGKTAKSVDQNSQNAIGVIANSPAWKAANADRQARGTQ